MHIPGFRAEASLYRSGGHYATVSSLGLTSPSLISPVAVPALAVSGPHPRLLPRGASCPTSAPICCEYDPESAKCIGGCCAKAANCCPDGKQGPGNRCTNVYSDPANCGRCGNQCPSNEKCLNGACTFCSPGQTPCGSECCSSVEVCQNGQCVCPAPSLICNGICTGVLTDPNNCGCCGSGCACSGSEVCCNGICTGNVPGVLNSNSNYFIDNACQNILGLSVILNVTQDMMSDNGFTLQLNANSPSGAEPDAFQQYGFSVTGNSIQGFINNWKDVSTQIVCGDTGLCSTPLDNGIPAGYTLILQLLNDNSGNITGANYSVLDNNRYILANDTFLVQNAGCNCGGTCLGFQQGDLSPVTAFTVDIVGPGNGIGTTFSSGGGSIMYSASGGPMVPMSSVPACVETDLQTLETSNASYGMLNGCPAQNITQPFSINPRTCLKTVGNCTGAGGSDQCITVNGVTKCCHSTLGYGQYPWIIGCDDGQIEDTGCSGPCY
jgi:hypothetical protein